jgi:hypothetical protein
LAGALSGRIGTSRGLTSFYRIDHRPTPDAAHVVLQILLLAVLITGVVAFYQVIRRPRFKNDVGSSRR